jgi:putative copper resistance protein D
MDLPLVVARFAHFAATMTLFGAALFAAALAPASIAGDLAPLMRRLGPPLALAALASAAAWLCLVAREMAGGGFVGLSAVLTDTAFGRVWQARLALAAALVIASLRPDRRWRTVAALAGLATASLGLVGHAATQEGLLGLGHRLNRALHLTCASAWLGGLPPFLVCLGLFAKSPARRDALAAMMRFSAVGHVFVPALFLTGALDVAMTSGAPPWPADTPYRAGLDGKILVFAAMAALALANRYLLAPRVGRSPFAAPALAAGAAAEIALALAALALVSAFATFDPAAR